LFGALVRVVYGLQQFVGKNGWSRMTGKCRAHVDDFGHCQMSISESIRQLQIFILAVLAL